MKIPEDGYLIVPNLVPGSYRQGVLKDILLHTEGGTKGADPNGMVEMYHYQSMWDLRSLPEIYDVFFEILGTNKLWVSIDRANYKAPLKFPWELTKLPMDLHWDICVNQKPRPVALQGLIALEDTHENMGGFRCLPDLYRNLDTWLSSLPTGKAIFPYFHTIENKAQEPVPRGWDLRPLEQWDIKEVPLKAGDLLIWDSFLPHANGINYGDLPRVAMYLTMFPEGDDRLREERVNCWRKNLPPSGWAFPGDPRLLEQSKPHPAKLSELGKRLLGLEKW